MGGPRAGPAERVMVPRRRSPVVWLCALVGALAVVGVGRPAEGVQPSPAAEQLLDRILAVVQGQVILLSDVRLFLDVGLVEPLAAADPIPPALERLIERRLILDEAARYVVDDPTPDQVDARMTQIVQHVGGRPALEAALAAAGYTAPDLEQVVLDNFRIERYLIRRFPPAAQPSGEAAAARQVIDDWLALLQARGAVTRVMP